MKKSIIFCSILVSGLGLAAWAGTQDPLTVPTQPQQTFTVCGPSLEEQEQQRLMHDAEMFKDMEERAKEVQSEHSHTQNYYRKFAEAEAHKWGGKQPWELNQVERAPDMVTVNSNGSWSKTYYNKEQH